ncbi:MAG TPA: citrate synthase [Acidimicrobiales bacterium]|jgi:citrate synthase|nr:citrate synthase [Acidimicrobiales bacterium]
MLESDEAARRLGVKVSTLYAYVSRGLLVSHAAPTGRRRLFEADEVERLARRSRQGKTVETRMATVTTGITQLTDGGPVYRGIPATELATRSVFEEVAEWLWDGSAADRSGFSPAPDGEVAGGNGAGAVRPWGPFDLGRPPAMESSDRMLWVVVMAGAGDRLRSDLRPDVVTATASRVAASMVDALAIPDPPPGPAPGRDSGRPGDGSLVLSGRPVVTGSLASRLAHRLTPSPGEALVRAVNAALVLMADHELATSTMAVRVAASTRADPYDALLAGLGTIAGPLHGGASQQAYSLLAEARLHGAARAVNDTLRWRGVLPGFGHSVYKSGDARFGVLCGLFEEWARAEDVEVVHAVVDLARDHSIPPPNVDLALAAMAWATGMPADAGRTLFTVARVAGWVAHYLEELGERPLRYRARAVYATSSSSPPGR